MKRLFLLLISTTFGFAQAACNSGPGPDEEIMSTMGASTTFGGEPGFSRTTYRITGYIKNADDSPVVGRQINCNFRDIGTYNTTTNSSGYYRFWVYGPKGDKGTLVTVSFSHNGEIVKRSKYVWTIESYGEATMSFRLDLKYALLVAGGSNHRFAGDTLKMYNTLIDHYGFTDERIYLISYHAELSPGYPLPRDRSLSKGNVEWAIGEIASRTESTSEVFVWWNGHASVDRLLDTDDYHSLLMTIDQLDDALDQISCKKMVLTFSTCHSASFIENLEENNRAILVSTSAMTIGHITPDEHHSYYAWIVMKALDPDYLAEDADISQDGRVSVQELHEYAFEYCFHVASQYPEIWCGSRIDPNSTFIGDGYY